jgi:hypothetical protein
MYSATIGSFERKNTEPLEAKYIFNTYADLVAFYGANQEWQDNLHEGLLKVVLDDGEGHQALYWAYDNAGTLAFKQVTEVPEVTTVDYVYVQLNGNFRKISLENFIKLLPTGPINKGSYETGIGGAFSNSFF